MKSILFLILMISSVNALANCPQFKETYYHCSSTSGMKIDSVVTKSRPPFYSFTITSGQNRNRYTVVTDGEPRDVTIQTQDGSEATYVEKAYCEDGKLIVVRSSEETTESDQRLYDVGESYLKIHHKQNGSFKDLITCHF